MDSTVAGIIATLLGLGVGAAIPIISTRSGQRAVFVNETTSMITLLRTDRDDWRRKAEECQDRMETTLAAVAHESARVADANRAERMINAETTAQAIKTIAESTPPPHENAVGKVGE